MMAILGVALEAHAESEFVTDDVWKQKIGPTDR